MTSSKNYVIINTKEEVNQMESNRLDELKILVNRLKLLLDDQQPGLASWCIAYGQTMQGICDFWTKN